MERKKFYHICTDGSSTKIIFKNDRDYIIGMNSIPVCMQDSGEISMYCFCLMSNHVHFIVGGSLEECVLFMKNYKRRISYRLSVTFNADTSIKEIGDPEYMERAITYVLRNPVAAKLPVTPWGYRWSSAGLYFRQEPLPSPGTKLMSSLNIREIRKCLNTHVIPSGNLCIDPNDLIIPDGYIDTQYVERLFKNPSHFMFMLSKNDDLEMEMTTDILKKTRYSDNELFNSMLDIIKKDFLKDGLNGLSIEKKLRLAVKLRKRYGANINQISRLTGINRFLLKKALGL